ncbi:response regulator [Caulobacter segnis]
MGWVGTAGTFHPAVRIPTMSRASILIVEDEYLVAADLEASLEELGYSCAGIAPDLETALALAASKPDLALVDIHLRDGQTGPLIAERLAQDHGVAVLFVTANPRMALDANPPGVIGVLNKPCHEDVVAAAVAYALQAKDGAPLLSPPSGLKLMQGA